MVLKPQDVVVVLKLLQYQGKRPSFSRIGLDLSMSPSEVHAAVKRARAAHLLHGAAFDDRPNIQALAEFLVHGVKYAFPAQRGGLSRGVATSYAAPPLNDQISPGSDPPPVWPYAEGTARGIALEPLYPKVPEATSRDPFLYELLALVDAIREGRARERSIAVKELTKRLRRKNHA
jgi:DNA-binding Lrp family transcriptional regulator